MTLFARPETVAVWREMAARRNATLGPATERMLAMARIGLGMRVLDLGTGIGDTALLAAARVGTGGQVVGTDVSQPMLDAAELARREAGVSQVCFRRMDAAALEFPEGEFAAVIARQVLMFLPDLGAALPAIRRVLRAGGRLAAVVWAALAENPLQAALVETARAMGKLRRDCELVVAFSLSEEELIAAMESAGFHEVAVEHVGGEWRFASLSQALEAMQANPVQRDVFAELDDEARGRAWAEVERRLRSFATANGCAIPVQVLVAAGTA